MKKKLFNIFTIFILILTITGCGKEKQNNSINQKEIDDFELKESSDKLLIKLDVERTIVLYHDNKNITKYELYTDAGSLKDAKDKYKSYIELETYKDITEVINFTRKGRYLVVEYDSSQFPVKTYEEAKKLQEMYSKINEK